MIWKAVVQEVLDVVADLGISTGDWGDQVPHAPAAIMAYPERWEYTVAGRRGGDRWPDAELVIVTGPTGTARALQDAADYANGTGAGSVIAALDQHTWTTCTDVTPKWAEMVTVTYAKADLQAVIIHLDIMGEA